jgi:aminoacylase
MSGWDSTDLCLNATERKEAVDAFVRSLQFKTVSGIGPEGSYDEMAQWLMSELTVSGISSVEIVKESKPGHPLVVATLEGSQPELPQLLLNSHYDVVPVVPEDWTVPPFDGLRQEGRVYGRGAQDMKCVVVGYIHALRKLLKHGFKPVRTIHLSFVPDEEIGGADGMQILLQSPWYLSKNIGLALDEGLASEDEYYSVFYGERLPWWIKMKADGNTGHASRFIEDTAVASVIDVVNRALSFREAQKKKLHSGKDQHEACSHSVAAKLGDVTSLNVTLLRAGVSAGGKDVLNVVPASAEAGFDIRISPSQPCDEVEAILNKWCEEVNASNGTCKITWRHENFALAEHHTTSLNETNPWWEVFRSTLHEGCGACVRTEVFPAATDSRFLRALGVKAMGFSPMRNSPILLHENDEYLSEDVFLEGVDVYVKLLRSLSSQKRFDTE